MLQNVATNGTEVTQQSDSSNTGVKLANNGRFAKGHDPRRNLNGRPRSFDQARKLALDVLHRDLPQSGMTVVEAILRAWAKSPKHQKDLIELGFGKVPDKLETTGLENKTTLVLHFDHEKGVTAQ